MKYVFVADAYITDAMMRNAAAQCLAEDDTAAFCFFGEENRGDMRNTVKLIEAGKREIVPCPPELYSLVRDAEVLVVHLCPVNRDLLENAPKLKAILSCRGGKENLDVECARERGIFTAVNPAHNANAVAEFTIGLMICESRNITRSDSALKAGIWREKYPNTVTTIREISDMTVGIIGYGSVGRLVAKKLSGFGCRVLVYDPYVTETAFDLLEKRFVSLDTLLRESDIITLHARSDTPILGRREFSLMKKTAYVINTARSCMIDSDALLEALASGGIMGAAIDVFESEPHIPEAYRRYDNLTLTNHRGGDTVNSYSDSPKFAIENYRHFLAGERALFRVI